MVKVDVKEEIQNALKARNVILGYRRTIRYVKAQKPRMVIMANNVPDGLKNEVAHNAKVSGTDVETFSGSSVDLGVFCGKPFPVAVLAIK